MFYYAVLKIVLFECGNVVVLFDYAIVVEKKTLSFASFEVC